MVEMRTVLIKRKKFKGILNDRRTPAWPREHTRMVLGELAFYGRENRRQEDE